MATKTEGETLRRKERVVARVDMPAIPAGTPGRVMMVAGFEWIRYWVRFENGVTRGSINRSKLARPDEWDEILERRARGEDEAEAADAPEAAVAEGNGSSPAPASGADDLTVGGVTIPGHLLERSRSRRAALGK